MAFENNICKMAHSKEKLKFARVSEKYSLTGKRELEHFIVK